MKCDSCEEHQQFLLDNGDGSQVICEHLIIDHDAVEPTKIATTSPAIVNDSVASSATAIAPIAVDTMSAGGSRNSVALSATAIAAPIAVDTMSAGGSRKRKFLSFKRFADLANDKMKRKIVPIVRWTTLTERTPYLAKRIIAIDTVVKGKPKIGHYVQLEDEDQMMKNVWITDIIREDLSKYPLHEERTYIMPLGDTISKETGYPYHDFTILEDKE